MSTIKIRQKNELDYKTSEAFKTLRANLEHRYKDVKSVAFVSVMGREGKTFVSFCTAKAMAAAGKKCVYLNANLREAKENEVVETEGCKHSLAEYLAGKCGWQEIVYQTEIENLSFITAGGPAANASELLGTHYFKELIEKLSAGYDYIVMDTAAMGEVSDALSVAHAAEGTVIVMEPEIVPYERAQKVKNMLEGNGCRLLGVVLNK